MSWSGSCLLPCRLGSNSRCSGKLPLDADGLRKSDCVQTRWTPPSRKRSPVPPVQLAIPAMACHFAMPTHGSMVHISSVPLSLTYWSILRNVRRCRLRFNSTDWKSEATAGTTCDSQDHPQFRVSVGTKAAHDRPHSLWITPVNIRVPPRIQTQSSFVYIRPMPTGNVSGILGKNLNPLGVSRQPASIRTGDGSACQAFCKPNSAPDSADPIPASETGLRLARESRPTTQRQLKARPRRLRHR